MKRKHKYDLINSPCSYRRKLHVALATTARPRRPFTQMYANCEYRAIEIEPQWLEFSTEKKTLSSFDCLPIPFRWTFDENIGDTWTLCNVHTAYYLQVSYLCAVRWLSNNVSTRFTNVVHSFTFTFPFPIVPFDIWLVPPTPTASHWKEKEENFKKINLNIIEKYIAKQKLSHSNK